MHKNGPLDRSGGHLGTSWGDLGALGRTWADLGTQELPKGRSLEPKMHQKRNQNDIEILIVFWIDFGLIILSDFGRAGSDQRQTDGGCGMRGAWLDSLSSKNSNKNSKTISISIRTRSDPSGGGGFNRYAHSARPCYFISTLGAQIQIVTAKLIIAKCCL